MRKPAIELLTVREAAELLRVSPITVRRHIAAGHIKAVRVGRAVRVPKATLDQLLRTAPVNRPMRDSIPQGRPTNEDDPLWDIIGIAETTGPTDVSENKHKYLAEAYAELHRE